MKFIAGIFRNLCREVTASAKLYISSVKQMWKKFLIKKFAKTIKNKTM